MPNSPLNPQDSNPTQKHRICDFCGVSTALLYCRADSAKLCLSCDLKVHSTNPLFTKHTRFQLCDVCDNSPASILCFTERSVLCQNCDFEAHYGSCAGHDRRPLEGFNGCPSVEEIAAFVGFDWCKGLSDDGEEIYEGFGEGLLEDGFCEIFVWDNPSVFSIDELIVASDVGHNFQAMVVPPLPKDRNVSSGKHKQEILRQLRELAKSDPNVKQHSDQFLRSQNQTMTADEFEKNLTTEHTLIQTFQHDERHATLEEHEGRSFSSADDAVNDFLSSVLLGSHNEDSTQNPDGHLSMYGGTNPVISGLNLHNNPVSSESVIIPPKVEFSSADRDTAISRYKEKKRARRYDKHIRYESRKVQAEGRTRINGRFAKHRKPASS